MDANDIRGRAKYLHADTVHMETAEDGKTVVRAAIYKGREKVYSYPDEKYNPIEFPDYDSPDNQNIRISKAGENEQESWRHV